MHFEDTSAGGLILQWECVLALATLQLTSIQADRKSYRVNWLLAL